MAKTSIPLLFTRYCTQKHLSSSPVQQLTAAALSHTDTGTLYSPSGRTKLWEATLFNMTHNIQYYSLLHTWLLYCHNYNHSIKQFNYCAPYF